MLAVHVGNGHEYIVAMGASGYGTSTACMLSAYHPPVPTAPPTDTPPPAGDVVLQPELPDGGIPTVVDCKTGTVLYKDSNCTIKGGTLGAVRTLPLLYKYPGFGKGHWAVVHDKTVWYVLDSSFIGPGRPA
jgi:hypothetical protein